jgi:hypothetical protein
LDLFDSTEIYEDGEYCAVCLGVNGLGQWHLIGTDAAGKTEPFDLTVCQKCYDDKPKLKKWLVAEMEAALEADPTMERMPDGRWKPKDSSMGVHPSISITADSLNEH